MRNRVLDEAHLPRHGLVLDLKAGSGLLTWEALRRLPEGGVYSLARNERDAEALRQLATRLPDPERPIVLQGELPEISDLLAWQAAAQNETVRFDALVGYNALFNEPDKQTIVALLATLLTPDGRFSLAERVPRYTQRLYDLVDLSAIDQDLAERVRQAEEAIYTDGDDPMVNWDVADLAQLFRESGFRTTVQVDEESSQLQISAVVIDRWFTPGTGVRPSYGQRLEQLLTPDEVKTVRALFERQLLNQSVAWVGKLLYLVAEQSVTA